MRPFAALRMRPTQTVSGPIALRSTRNVNNVSSNTVVVTFPVGAAAGDSVILMVASGDGVITPSGWFQHQSNAPFTGWSAQIFSKVLTSGDITTGSVTLSRANSGTFQIQIMAFCFVGPALIRSQKVASTLDGAAVNGQSFSFPDSLSASDIVVAAATGRGNSATIAISPGTQMQANAQTNGSIAGYSYTMPSGGTGSFTPSNIVSTYEYIFFGVALTTDAAPIFSVNPSITSTSGFFADGDTLTGVRGVHNGISSTIKWTRDGVDISGATSLTYTLTGADVGHVIRFVETATNELSLTASGSSSPTSSIVSPSFTTITRKTSDTNDRKLSDGTTRTAYIRTA